MATALATDDPTININVVVDGVKKNLRGDSPAHMYPHHAHEGEGGYGGYGGYGHGDGHGDETTGSYGYGEDEDHIDKNDYASSADYLSSEEHYLEHQHNHELFHLEQVQHEDFDKLVNTQMKETEEFYKQNSNLIAATTDDTHQMNDQEWELPTVHDDADDDSDEAATGEDDDADDNSDEAATGDAEEQEDSDVNEDENEEEPKIEEGGTTKEEEEEIEKLATEAETKMTQFMTAKEGGNEETAEEADTEKDTKEADTEKNTEAAANHGSSWD